LLPLFGQSEWGEKSEQWWQNEGIFFGLFELLLFGFWWDTCGQDSIPGHQWVFLHELLTLGTLTTFLLD